ncbi:MAG: spore protease YyaC [Clostridia bacterium]|nr:spore protease YyaC [Clostridia bacterium]MDR3643606.1 spore protease YyaC [Clostridia bacterium]
MFKNPESWLFDTAGRPAQWRLNETLFTLIKESGRMRDDIAVVCIGSDRLIGDSYGPLTGHMLSRLSLPGFSLFGSLVSPVHALTISEALERIDTQRTLVIAVDSCVGGEQNIGCIAASNEPLRPGSGLGKSLPAVGDISITGIAAADGSPFLNLQNASLGMIYKMAECTASAIEYALFARQRAVRSGTAPFLRAVAPARFPAASAR